MILTVSNSRATLWVYGLLCKDDEFWDRTRGQKFYACRFRRVSGAIDAAVCESVIAITLM